MLSFGPSWEDARPVVFDSMTFKGPELNYPVHEKELLSIMRALRKWKIDLIRSEFYMYTDHKTLLNFDNQKELSRRQARWMEELAIYNCKFVYIKGEDNCVADGLSRYPQTQNIEGNARHPYCYSAGEEVATITSKTNSIMEMVGVMSATIPEGPLKLELQFDKKMIDQMKEAYKTDVWCQKLLSASKGMLKLTVRDGLWFLGNRLIVPSCMMREYIFTTAHDALGHFGFSKTYESI